jgi:hypothetical protein
VNKGTRSAARLPASSEAEGNYAHYLAGVSDIRKKLIIKNGNPMKTVTLGQVHIPILKNENQKDEFVAGMISILQEKEPKASSSYMEDIFNLLIHGPIAKVIPGIPQFDPTGMKKSELARYNKIQAGKVPSGGLDHRYTDLQFKPITTLDKGYLSKLYNDCQSRINDKQRPAEYRRFISYLAEVIKHCAESGEI